MKWSRLWRTLAFATTALAPVCVHAQTAGSQPVSPPAASTAQPDSTGSAQVEEIVVTAERREANLQSVPIAVSAVTGTTLAQQGIQNTQDLVAAVPGLVVTTESGDTKTFLRGVGTTATATDNSVATYVDGVYIAAQSASLLNLSNIARVEVLKGPQGTLFGRNSTGGVIQIITKDPSATPHADVSVGYANYSTYTANFYGTTGIGDHLAADFAAYYSDQQDGWGRNVTTGAKTFTGNVLSLRTKWVWTPDPDTKITFSADYLKDRQETGLNWSFLPGSTGVDGATGYVGFYNNSGNLNDGFTDDQYGLMLRAEHDFGFARLVSISGYRNSINIQTLDEDATPLPIVDAAPLPNKDLTFSEELQLVSSRPSKLQWILGFYYLNDKFKSDPLNIAESALGPDGAVDVYVREPTVSYAGYGQATYEFLPGTHATVGLRYTSDDKKIGGTTYLNPGSIVLVQGEQDNTFSKLTYRFALDHQFGPDVLGYVSYNRGFKSGQYSLVNYLDPPVQPEVLDAYEAGFKSELFDHRLRLNASAFYYNYTNIQVEQLVTGGTKLLNAAAAHIYGADADFVAAISNQFSINGSLSLLHGRYTSFPDAPEYNPSPAGGDAVTSIDASGNTTVNSPTVTAAIAANYKLPTQAGDFDFNVNYSYNSGYFWNPDNQLKQPSYSLLGAYVAFALKGGTWDIRVWGSNLNGAKYYSFENAFAFGNIYSPAAPRTFGVTLGAHF